MNKTSRVSLFLTVALTASFLLGATATSLAQTSPTTDELQKKIEDLERQIADVKAQLAAPPAAPATPPPPAAAPASAAAAAPAPSAPSGLAALLGPTTLSGFADVYYGYNSNQPDIRTTALRNFDINSGQFSLNMIELIADKATSTDSRVGYHVALGFGQAMNLINSGEFGSPLIPTTPVGSPAVSNFDQYLKEGYIEYLAPVGKSGLTIDFGKFVTNAGAEVIETKDNWNYSRGLLFSWAIPYFHFGMRAKYAFNGKVALTGFILNGWNNSVDDNSGKTTGFTLALTPTKKLSIFENYYVGPEQANNNSDFRHLTDTVLLYNATSKLSLQANYDYGHDHLSAVNSPTGFPLPVWWSGIAGYIKYAPNAKWAVATRGEYFVDHNGFSTGTAQKVGEFTGTLERTLAGHIISRLEYRRDMSDQDVFPYRSSYTPGSPFSPVDHQNTVTVGFVYAFTTAPPAP